MKLTVVFVVMLPLLVTSSKIFFLAYPSFSHMQSMSTIADRLVERGHEVWISATSDMAEKLNLKSRGIKATPFSSETAIRECMDTLNSAIPDYFNTGKRTLFTGVLKNTSHLMLTDELFLSTIEKQKFDLAVVDVIPIVHMLSLIPYKYDIPHIYFGPNYSPYLWRIPYLPSFVPFVVYQYSDSMSFTERLVNTITHGVLLVNDPFSYMFAAATYVPEKPYIEIYDIILKARLYILERNAVLDYPAPSMPNVKQIASITSQSKSQIPAEYASFLDKSKHGVILVSFGSMTPTTNLPIFDKLLAAFQKIKYDVIIKGNFANSSERVMVSQWIPQKALLGHKNVKLFITHCGANGVGEAITYGVPMLGFPFFAEQPGNAHKVFARGYGLYLDFYSTTSEIIIEKINEVIDNTKYKSNVVKASRIIQDLGTRSNPTEEAVFWMEHVIKYGGDYLRSPSVDMPLYQYLLLDVLAFIVFILVIVIFILFKCFKCFCKSVGLTKKAKKE